MSLLKSLLGATTLCSFCLTAALAQAPAGKPAAPAATAAANEPQLSGVQMPWVKLCEKVPFEENKPESVRQVCLIAQEVRAENGQILATVQIREIEKDPKKAMIIAVPPGMLLQPGIRVTVDKGEPVAMRYEACMPSACFAQMDLTDDMIKRMKAGKVLSIQVVNMTQRAVALGLNLETFAKAYDGPALDPRAQEEEQRKLAEAMQKKADDARKALQPK